MSLEPLRTNQSSLRYVLSHIQGFVGTVLAYCRSRKHQGDFNQTADVVLGMLAFSKAGSDPETFAVETTQKLLKNPDWRLKTLGILVAHQLSAQHQARLLSLNQEIPRSPSVSKFTVAHSLLGCRQERKHRRSTSRTSVIIHGFSTPPCGGSPAIADRGEEEKGQVPGALVITTVNPLREPQHRKVRVAGLGLHRPPPPPAV